MTTGERSRSAVRGRSEWPATPVIIASHRRSGTHLMIDLLRRQFEACASWKRPLERSTGLYLDTGWLAGGHVNEGRARRIISRAAVPIIKSHDLPRFGRLRASQSEWADWLAGSRRVIYMVRDGRVVMHSLHRYLAALDPVCRVPIGVFMAQRRPLAEFIAEDEAGLSRPAAWARHVEAWRGRPGALVLRYEDVVRDPAAALSRIGEHLGLAPRMIEPLLPPRPRFRSVARLTKALAMRPVSTAILSPSDSEDRVNWRDRFEPSDRRFFHDEAGAVLEGLGYEDSDAWVGDGTDAGGPT